MSFDTDERVVLTLDAGGTNFVFSAIQSNREVVEPVRLPSETQSLELSLRTIEAGFRHVMSALDREPAAISFAFPGPADYPNGIIDNVSNLPAFAGSVPLGPWLENQFGLPVFINNDGNLFVFGEAIAGLLPAVNRMLAEAGNSKRFRILFGVTLGTGFGAGLVHDGRIVIGDNSNAAEIWLQRNKVHPEYRAEDGACIRAVQDIYAKTAGIALESAQSPKEIAAIALGDAVGNQSAAIEAYRELGEVVGDALANAITLLDGLVVIGGGLSQAHSLFMPAVMDELNGTIKGSDGASYDRVVQHAFNLEDPAQRAEFVRREATQIPMPGSDQTIACDLSKRIGIGASLLGTSQAVGIGAYAFALSEIDRNRRS